MQLKPNTFYRNSLGDKILIGTHLGNLPTRIYAIEGRTTGRQGGCYFDIDTGHCPDWVDKFSLKGLYYV